MWATTNFPTPAVLSFAAPQRSVLGVATGLVRCVIPIVCSVYGNNDVCSGESVGLLCTS